jgi:hypothetical protein
MGQRIDEDARILDFDVTGVTAQRALESALALLASRPELWQWDWIVTVIDLPDDASVEQVAELARHYALGLKADAVIALISHDTNLHLWAEVMDFQFPGRKHRVVADRAEALSLIEARRALRT